MTIWCLPHDRFGATLHTQPDGLRCQKNRYTLIAVEASQVMLFKNVSDEKVTIRGGEIVWLRKGPRNWQICSNHAVTQYQIDTRSSYSLSYSSHANSVCLWLSMVRLFLLFSIMAVYLGALFHTSRVYAAQAGVTEVGDINYPNGGMVEIARFVDFKHENNGYCAIANQVGTKSWIGIGGSPGLIAQINPVTMQRSGNLLLQPNESAPLYAAMDPQEKFGYFTVYAESPSIVKVDLTNLSRVAALNLPGEPIGPLVMDPNGNFLYAGVNATPGKVVRIDLATFTRKDDISLPAGEESLRCGAMDPLGAFAYFACGNTSIRMLKIRLSNFTRVNSIAISDNGRAESMTIEPSGALAYIADYGGTADFIGKIKRVNLTNFFSVDTLPLHFAQFDAYGAMCVTIDKDGTEGLVLTQGGRGGSALAVKLDLATFTLDPNYKLIPGFGNGVAGAVRVGGTPENILVYYDSIPAIVNRVDFDGQPGARLIFNGGEEEINAITQDADGRYLYLSGVGGKIVKFDLERFKRVGGLLTNLDSRWLYTAATDGRYGYFGSYETRENKVVYRFDAHLYKVDLHGLQITAQTPYIQASRRMSTLAYNAYNATVDMITSPSLPEIPRIASIDAATVSTYDDSLELVRSHIYSNLVVSPLNGDFYFIDNPNGIVERLHTGTISYANPIFGGFTNILRNSQSGNIYATSKFGQTLELKGDDILSAVDNLDMNAAAGWQGMTVAHGALDRANRFAIYDSTEPSPALVKHDLIDFTKAAALPVDFQVKDMQADYDGTRLFVADNALTGGLRKVRLTPRERMEGIRFHLTETAEVNSVNFYAHAAVGPRRVEVLPTGYDQTLLSTAFFDRVHSRIWYGTRTNPGTYMCFNTVTRAITTTRSLQAGEENLNCGACDPSGTYGYFGTRTSPAKVIKIRLADGARIDALTLNSGEDELFSAAVDATGTFAYFGTGNFPTKIVKVRLSNFTHADTLTLNADEYGAGALVIDPAGEFMYSSAGLPGRVVKVRLSDFTRVNAIPLSGNSALGLAIDPAGTYLYAANNFTPFFGETTLPGAIDRIALDNFTKVETSLTLTMDEKRPHDLAMDPNGQFLLAACTDNPAKVVKIDLPTFSRVAGTFLRQGLETGPRSIFLDANGQYAFLGMSTIPGRIVTYEPSPKPLRLAIYGDVGAQQTLFWQSPALAVSQADNWIQTPISEGTPSTLKLFAGSYTLAWQCDADESVPSFTPGNPGDGIQLPMAYGPFAATLNPAADSTPSWTTTASRWSMYLDYTSRNSARDWQGME